MAHSAQSSSSLPTTSHHQLFPVTHASDKATPSDTNLQIITPLKTDGAAKSDQHNLMRVPSDQGSSALQHAIPLAINNPNKLVMVSPQVCKNSNQQTVDLTIKLVDPKILRTHEQVIKGRDVSVAKEIKELGVFTRPIIVAEYEQGKYGILDGHHRHQAALLLNLTSVPILIVPYINLNTTDSSSTQINQHDRSELVSLHPGASVDKNIGEFPKETVIGNFNKRKNFPRKSTAHALSLIPPLISISYKALSQRTLATIPETIEYNQQPIAKKGIETEINVKCPINDQAKTIGAAYEFYSTCTNDELTQNIFDITVSA